MSADNYISIGRGSYGAFGHLRYGDEEIEIGRYCSIAQEVKMIAGGGHRRDTVSSYPFDVLFLGVKTGSPMDRCYEPGPGIKIGSDVHIGFGATIIGHVNIGNGAVIAANATVFTDVPDYGIAVGNPARVTKFRFSEEIIAALLRIQWWNWDEEKIRAEMEGFYGDVKGFCIANDEEYRESFKFHPLSRHNKTMAFPGGSNAA